MEDIAVELHFIGEQFKRIANALEKLNEAGLAVRILNGHHPTKIAIVKAPDKLG